MATLNFKGHSVEVETWDEFTAPVERVTNSNGYWCNAHLENGDVIRFHLENKEDNFKFINSLLKYKGTAYSEELWEKQKLIIELNQLTQEFKISFLQVDSHTDFIKYGDMVSRMKKITDVILKN